LSPLKILVIDDSVSDVSLLRFAFDQQGEAYMLEILSDGADALRFISEQRGTPGSHEPCVIILDLHLVAHSGLAVLQAIRENPVLTHIKVVVLSGAASPREQSEIERLGAIFRHKPMVLNEFIDLGAEILGLCRGVLGAAV
jgi:two-component system response regulator